MSTHTSPTSPDLRDLEKRLVRRRAELARSEGAENRARKALIVRQHDLEDAQERTDIARQHVASIENVLIRAQERAVSAQSAEEF